MNYTTKQINGDLSTTLSVTQYDGHPILYKINELTYFS